jgi:hypothetical protein
MSLWNQVADGLRQFENSDLDQLVNAVLENKQ